MLYLVAMLQPIMPLIEYQTNKEYIASALCENRNKPEMACNGKCYLNKKIEASKNHDSHDHSLPKIDLSKYPVVPINANFKKDNAIVDIKRTAIFYSIQTHPKNYISSAFKPPQIISQI
jgi:hypothetical protein